MKTILPCIFIDPIIVLRKRDSEAVILKDIETKHNQQNFQIQCDNSFKNPLVLERLVK